MPQRGVILVNLGTPASATAQGVRDFLRAFLSDRRVVDVPRWLWWPLLHGVILPLRSRRVAKAYAQIWQPGGSPLMVISRQQQVAVQEALQGLGYGVPVELAMSYGEPSLGTAWSRLKAQGVDEVLIAAKQLLAINGIEQVAADTVTYFHILFDAHEIVLSNGAETESLYTGAQALKAVGPAARAEILALFPELRDTPAEAARCLVPGGRAQQLARRHARNGKDLIQAI